MSHIEAAINSSKKYLIEFFLVLSGFISVSVSLFFSYTLNDFSWFSRSGALMVLFAIVAAYRLAIKQQNLNEAARSDVSHLITRFKPVMLEVNAKRIQLAAHFSAVVGTLIWGYGDLLG